MRLGLRRQYLSNARKSLCAIWFPSNLCATFLLTSARATRRVHGLHNWKWLDKTLMSNKGPRDWYLPNLSLLKKLSRRISGFNDQRNFTKQNTFDSSIMISVFQYEECWISQQLQSSVMIENSSSFENAKCGAKGGGARQSRIPRN